MTQVPKSPYEKTGELYYLPRMLDKMRLHDKGVLREDLRDNLGEGFDGYLCHFLNVEYNNLQCQISSGKSDQEILNWCFENGRSLDQKDITIWNLFIAKAGWNDHISEILERRKKESGLENRDDIVTMFQYLDADEGR
jgi:gluconokinase